MSNHSHKHEHCKHESVKFCSHCNVVYCASCNEEWTKNPPYWYKYYNANPQVTYTYQQGNLGQAIPMSASTVTCSHTK